MSTAAPARCPYSRSLSKLTWEYSISLGYGDFTEVLDRVSALYDHVDAWVDDKAIEMFEALLEQIHQMRQWTGVPA